MTLNDYIKTFFGDERNPQRDVVALQTGFFARGGYNTIEHSDTYSELITDNNQFLHLVNNKYADRVMISRKNDFTHDYKNADRDHFIWYYDQYIQNIVNQYLKENEYIWERKLAMLKADYSIVDNVSEHTEVLTEYGKEVDFNSDKYTDKTTHGEHNDTVTEQNKKAPMDSVNYYNDYNRETDTLYEEYNDSFEGGKRHTNTADSGQEKVTTDRHGNIGTIDASTLLMHENDLLNEVLRLKDELMHEIVNCICLPIYE